MASYRGHLSVASALGVAYGGAGVLWLGLDWGTSALAAGLTAVGGLMPDLDSDSGVPVRELFSLAAVVTPLMMLRRLINMGLSHEQVLAVMGGTYIFIRFGLSWVFRWLTVHRGMFHSLPAMLIAGLSIFLLYHSPDVGIRYYLAAATMIGFLSHLVLDELYSVNFMGVKLHRNKFAGSAVKFYSKSWPATVTCYTILGGLAFVAWSELGR
jgi:hypothetical protein